MVNLGQEYARAKFEDIRDGEMKIVQWILLEEAQRDIRLVSWPYRLVWKNFEIIGDNGGRFNTRSSQ